MKKRTLLIPAMLDAHFPLLRLAFETPRRHAVILDGSDGITNIGLQYVHNDLCYPGILIVGQLVQALRSGRYDLSRTEMLMPQGGDACRGSNYLYMTRKALDRAGFPQIPVLSLNMTGLSRGERLSVSPAMVLKALGGAIYGDLLMHLCNQIAPYERRAGETEIYRRKWQTILAHDITHLRHLSPSGMRWRMNQIAADFTRIPRRECTLRKVALVGELYIKYCHLGNWNIERYLRSQNCEYAVNGMMWYVLYYMDTHLLSDFSPLLPAFHAAFSLANQVHCDMIDALRSHGFHSLPPYWEFKGQATGYVPFGCAAADGWLIGAEIVGHVKNSFHKVLCMQPFGCMPNHICGRGLYSSLQRRLPDAQLVSVDVDSSGNDTLAKSRVQMLLDYDRTPLP